TASSPSAQPPAITITNGVRVRPLTGRSGGLAHLDIPGRNISKGKKNVNAPLQFGPYFRLVSHS
ncbi:hypothetical protein, partial [Mycolicibacterium fortuitum]|uniref:hypothetical protein n=1 Tax=Mycolicibacterium fortuitum TaxID=1766 RepID=UPI001A976107